MVWVLIPDWEIHTRDAFSLWWSNLFCSSTWTCQSLATQILQIQFPLCVAGIILKHLISRSSATGRLFWTKPLKQNEKYIVTEPSWLHHWHRTYYLCLRLIQHQAKFSWQAVRWHSWGINLLIERNSLHSAFLQLLLCDNCTRKTVCIFITF